MADEKKDKKISFKDTLNLPHTDFPIRANAKENDPTMLNVGQKRTLIPKLLNVIQVKKNLFSMMVLHMPMAIFILAMHIIKF